MVNRWHRYPVQRWHEILIRPTHGTRLPHHHTVQRLHRCFRTIWCAQHCNVTPKSWQIPHTRIKDHAVVIPSSLHDWDVFCMFCRWDEICWGWVDQGGIWLWGASSKPRHEPITAGFQLQTTHQWRTHGWHRCSFMCMAAASRHLWHGAVWCTICLRTHYRWELLNAPPLKCGVVYKMKRNFAHKHFAETYVTHLAYHESNHSQVRWVMPIVKAPLHASERLLPK